MRRRITMGLVAAAAALSAFAHAARADDATPGFPEAVLQWDVQKGESCEDVAKALYGDPKHAHLVMRYNRVVCTRGAPLKPHTTLVMPAKVTTVPSAVLTSMVPAVRAKSPGASWGDAAPGMPLSTNANVNTMDHASANIHFIDRTKVFLSENTLVVIFGTASQSSVSKAVPPAVEVDAGEIRAALSALRGDSAEVSVPGGGRVSAASRDTVVERKGERTTVSVFDGKAHVANAGQSVDVPKNFGTRFVGQKPPAPPRPLPPAPDWEKAPDATIFGSAGKADLATSWKPVASAKAYRVELATDTTFDDLITREEVPADVLAFRASGLPKGSYALRVRAIDKEDYLGVASVVASFTVVDAVASAGGATVEGGVITTSPYAALAFEAPKGTEVSVDDGPFQDNAGPIDLASTRPSRITLRHGGADARLTVRYRMPTTSLAALRDAHDVGTIRVDLTGLESELVAAVRPVAKVHRAGAAGWESVTLRRDDARPASFVALVEGASSVDRVEVFDAFGAPLAARDGFDDASPPAPPKQARKKAKTWPRIGVDAPSFSPDAHVVDWSSPTAPGAASVAFAFGHGFQRGKTNAQGRVQATGSIGPVGLEASLFTDDLVAPIESHETGWLGARVRLFRLGDAKLELAPIGRLGVSRGPRPVLGVAGVALGGVAGKVSWLADIAFSFRPETDPRVPGFVGGVTLDALAWLRPYATIDLFGADIAGKTRAGGGLTLGAEAGTRIFGTAAARVSPFAEPLGGASLMIGAGVRTDP